MYLHNAAFGAATPRMVESPALSGQAPLLSQRAGTLVVLMRFDFQLQVLDLGRVF